MAGSSPKELKKPIFSVLQAERLEGHRCEFSFQRVAVFGRFGARAAVVLHGKRLVGARQHEQRRVPFEPSDTCLFCAFEKQMRGGRGRIVEA